MVYPTLPIVNAIPETTDTAPTEKIFLAIVKNASLAPVQKLVPWMAVWMYACFAMNFRHFSRQNKQQSTQQQTQRATRLL